MPSQRAPYPLIGSYDVQRDVVLDGQRTINMYEIPVDTTIQKRALVPASGFESPFTVGAGPIRLQFIFKDIMYVVSGDEIYSVDTALTPTLLGAMATSAGFVRATANQGQVIFVDGVNAYLWTISPPAFTLPVIPPGVAPIDVTVLDDYFILLDGDAPRWYVSNLNDGSTWNVLNFVNFNSTPDTLSGTSVLKRRIYIFGNQSTEVWYDAGAADFPFRRDNNSLFEHGCAARNTIREGFELLFYVAKNKDGPAGVMMASGVSNPVKISTPAIDLFLQNTPNIEDGQAILYQENGLIFYQLSFTEEEQTFVYVVQTGQWHELGLPNGNRHPAGSHAFFDNKHFIGMFNTNEIFEMSYRFITYNEELIRCERIGAPFFDTNHRRIRVDRFELESITGIPDGTLPNQLKYAQLDELVKKNESPTLILYVSRDGGRTFGNGRRATLGKIGDYLHRILWTRLGVYKGRRIVFKIEFPFKVPFYIMGAYIIYEVLPE